MNDPTLTIGPIMKAARKFKKFNQAAVAQAIGCSQSALSKMEHNLLVPSAPQWFLFSRFTSIPPETLESGIIDRHTLVKFNNTEVSMGFKIPKKYRNFRAQKVREIYPFMKFLEKHGGPEGVKEYITFTGLDPEFFLDFDNLINFQFFADTIGYIMKKDFIISNKMQEIVKLGQNEVFWNHYGVQWSKLSSAKEVLSEFVNEQLFFQTDFQVRLDQKDGKFIICYIPEYHLKQFKDLTADFIDTLNTYRKFTLENLIQKSIGKEVKVSLLPDHSGTMTLGAKFEVET